jgi:hypothetical protein
MLLPIQTANMALRAGECKFPGGGHPKEVMTWHMKNWNFSFTAKVQKPE